MLFQEAPADTFNFMVLGFSVILGAMAVYILSYYLRVRNLKRDLQYLEETEAE